MVESQNRVLSDREIRSAFASLIDRYIDWGKGKGHVGFIIGQNGNNYVMLGGNQKDAVRYSEFKKSLFTSFRYPNNYSTIGGGLPRCKATSINPSTR